MGFRKDTYATVWSVEPVTESWTKARISISHKDKQTGEYTTDFSGFVGFIGTAAAKNALSLKEKDRIKLGDVDVTTKYDKEKDKIYTNFKIFNFELQNGGEQQNPATGEAESPQVDDGEVEALPF